MPTKSDDRKARLADALRRNLRRRKAAAAAAQAEGNDTAAGKPGGVTDEP